MLFPISGVSGYWHFTTPRHVTISHIRLLIHIQFHRRQQQEFVGRDEPLTLFRENLALYVDDERRRFMFDVFGQGGVGKTSLLRCFSQLAESAGYARAWTDETHEDVLAVMASVAKQLDQNFRTFSSFPP